MDYRAILSLGVLAMFLLPGSLSVAIWDRASLVCSTIPGKQ